MKKTEKKPIGNRLLFFVAGLVLSAAAVFLLQSYVIKKKPDMEKQLLAIANEVNKGCPVMIDKTTRFDNVVVMPGNVFQYRYTLTDAARDRINTNDLIKYVRPNVIENIRKTDELKFQRDNNITFSYYYKDYQGEYVTDFSVTPVEYAEKDTIK
jgi:hypothetical protein